MPIRSKYAFRARILNHPVIEDKFYKQLAEIGGPPVSHPNAIACDAELQLTKLVHTSPKTMTFRSTPMLQIQAGHKQVETPSQYFIKPTGFKK
jgi:hypothetical protein